MISGHCVAKFYIVCRVKILLKRGARQHCVQKFEWRETITETERREHCIIWNVCTVSRPHSPRPAMMQKLDPIWAKSFRREGEREIPSPDVARLHIFSLRTKKKKKKKRYSCNVGRDAVFIPACNNTTQRTRFLYTFSTNGQTHHVCTKNHFICTTVQNSTLYQSCTRQPVVTRLHARLYPPNIPITMASVLRSVLHMP